MTPPPSDIAVHLDLAAALLTDQHPDLAELPLRPATKGWDNATFRLGEDMALRLPRRAVAAQLIENEQRWLPDLAPRLPIAIPAAIRLGKPGAAFPHPWSVVPWFEGGMALLDALHRTEARRIGSFLRALHRLPVPADAPTNPYSGVPLAGRRDLYEMRIRATRHALGDDLADACLDLMRTAIELKIDEEPAWLHGDLHSKNVIARDGRIVAVIDWGDICAGDPATDLAALWILFEPAHHELFWQAYGEISPNLRRRSRAWAVAFGIMLYDSHHQADPTFAEAGITTIRRAVRDT